MAINTQQFNFFDNTGGMNTSVSKAQQKDNEHSLLLNVVVSDTGSLRKRSGYVKLGDLIDSGSKIVGLDKYKTFSKSTLLTFANQKAFYYSGDNTIRLNNIEITAITNPSSTTFRYAFATSATTDISSGEYVSFQNCSNSSNNGTFEITAIASTYVEVTNASGVVETPLSTSIKPIAAFHKLEYPVAIINLASNVSSASSYDASEGTIEVVFSSVHSFIVGDRTEVTIGSTDYESLYVEEVLSTTSVKLSGVYEDFSSSITGVEKLYGYRTGIASSIDWDSDGEVEDIWGFPVFSFTGVDTEDTINILGYNRSFRITDTDPLIVYLDEQLELRHGTALCVSGRFEQFSVANGNCFSNTPFDTKSSTLLTSVFCTTLNDNLYAFNGSDEAMRYDGIGLYRAGFHETPAIIVDPQAVPFFGSPILEEGAKYTWKYSYQYTDANNRIYESKISPASIQVEIGTAITSTTGASKYTGAVQSTSSSKGYLTVDSSLDLSTVKPGDLVVVDDIGSTSSNEGQYTAYLVDNDSHRIYVNEPIPAAETGKSETIYTVSSKETLVPVVDIPEGKNNNLGYDLSNLYVNLYRTSDDGLLYFLSQQTKTSKTGNYRISTLTKDTSLSTVQITDITYVSGNTIKYTFNSSTDLSSVVKGAYLNVPAQSGLLPSNQGTFVITKVNNVTTKYVEVHNERRFDATDDETTISYTGSINLLTLSLLDTPDLSGISTGDYILLKNNKDIRNNGIFVICKVDDTLKTLLVANPDAQTSSSENALGFICLYDNQVDSLLTSSSELYTNSGIEENNEEIPISKYCTVFDNRLWIANGRNYQYSTVQIVDVEDVNDGDKLYITDGTTTECYEFDTNGSVTSGNMRVDVSGVTNVADVVIAISEAINAKADGLVYSYYEDLTKPGTFLLKERQRNGVSFQVKVNVTTIANYRINDSSATNDTYEYFIFDPKYSRVWYSKQGKPESFVGCFDDINGGFYIDISPDDGDYITGLAALSDNLIVFKEDSCYRVSKTGNDVFTVERISPDTGCYAPKSISVIGNSVYFCYRDGIYTTDGYYVNYIGIKLSEYSKDCPQEFLVNACATNYLNNMEYRLSVPYGQDQETNNYVFVFNYNYNSWSIFDNFEATNYAYLNDEQYFSTYNGHIYKIRNTGEKTDYRDDFDAIDGRIYTKWYDLGAPSIRKMVSKIVLHLFQSEVDSISNIAYSYDFRDTFIELDSFSLDTSRWGNFNWGKSVWGYYESLPLKLSPSPEKNLYCRFSFTNNSKDEVLYVLGWTLEAKLLSSKAIHQSG